MIRPPLAALAIAACMAAAPLAAAQNGYADLPDVDAQVAGFTGMTIGQTGGAAMPVDRRLRLAACASPLSLSWRTPRHDTVLVECPDPGSWHLFVPVKAAGGAVGGMQAIARGESVTIAVAGDGFTVSQPGEAMDSGAVGEWIRVRSVGDGSPKGQPIRAEIVRPGEVAVPLP